jgi:MYXO-CTERM domain-containing protein
VSTFRGRLLCHDSGATAEETPRTIIVSTGKREASPEACAEALMLDDGVVDLDALDDSESAGQEGCGCRAPSRGPLPFAGLLLVLLTLRRRRRASLRA